jgi:transposase InsO family protein
VTTAGFLARTVLAFAEAGITIERVLTDNAFNYRRSNAFRAVAEANAIGLRHTRPYRPQTNGKAEAFNKTIQREWAYRRPFMSNAERLDALAPFLAYYNHQRPHTALGNRPPASRL